MAITRVITVCGIFAYARSTPAKSNITSDYLAAECFGYLGQITPSKRV